MTREEYLKACFESHIKEEFEQHIIENTDFIDDLRSAFYEGVRAADKNPQYTWISVNDDLPFNHEELITKDGITTVPVPIIDYDGFLRLSHMTKVMSSKGYDRWIWPSDFTPRFWFKLPIFDIKYVD